MHRPRRKHPPRPQMRRMAARLTQNSRKLAPSSHALGGLARAQLLAWPLGKLVEQFCREKQTIFLRTNWHHDIYVQGVVKLATTRFWSMALLRSRKVHIAHYLSIGRQRFFTQA
jgi:hypothetical protein